MKKSLKSEELDNARFWPFIGCIIIIETGVAAAYGSKSGK